MKEKNITALVSCFARCYHFKNNKFRIYSDNYAEKILSTEEYALISSNMVKGINFFNSNFSGTDEEALKYIVNNQLSPSVLGRSAFCEKMLNQELRLGCKQYLIFASGYDTSGYKYSDSNISIFEIDKKEMIENKKKRIQNSNISNKNINYIITDFTDRNWIKSIIKSKYKSNERSFSSLLGISYYLSCTDFNNMIKEISNVITDGSSIVFDYPTINGSNNTDKNEQLALGANEEMKSKYSYADIEKILSANGLLIYEHLNDKEITKKYFYDYNTLNPQNRIIAPQGVAYCFAVKKSI